MTYFSNLVTPIGSLLLVSRGPDESLTGIYMQDQISAPLRDQGWIEDDARFVAARSQLAGYFAGSRTSFDLSLAPIGTPFQQRVWSALAAIPFGETVSYVELARRIGMPKGSRAVGHANARNPISIVVPCHRVIGSDGSLTGYAGGAERKRWLLDWEAQVTRRPTNA